MKFNVMHGHILKGVAEGNYCNTWKDTIIITSSSISTLVNKKFTNVGQSDRHFISCSSAYSDIAKYRLYPNLM